MKKIALTQIPRNPFGGCGDFLYICNHDINLAAKWI